VTVSFSPDRQSRDIDSLARTIWGEARNQSVRCQEAVACVVMNRLNAPADNGAVEWGGSIAEICLAPPPFDCWNMEQTYALTELCPSKKEPVFEQCLRIARRAIAGTLKDCTNRATHFHADHISPRWASGHIPSAWIGTFLFYNDIAQHQPNQSR